MGLCPCGHIFYQRTGDDAFVVIFENDGLYGMGLEQVQDGFPEVLLILRGEGLVHFLIHPE